MFIISNKKCEKYIKAIAKSNIWLYNEHMFDIQQQLTTQEKLHILADAAKYDVACTSSGADRRGKEGFLGNAQACGICHSFAADGRCISLLKILMTNNCIYDCKYCVNRSSNDVKRAQFTPQEICDITVEFYKRNYIEGLFLSSGVIKNPAYTMEKMCETLYMLRYTYKFNGYIHIKTIPGAPDELIATAGYLADRMSINLELPTAESLKKLAPNKNFKTILTPMQKVSDTIAVHRMAIGKDSRMERSSGNQYLSGSIFSKKNLEYKNTRVEKDSVKAGERLIGLDSPKAKDKSKGSPSIYTKEQLKSVLPLSVGKSLERPFSPAGQSTQMIIGATDETDLNLIKTTQTLYQSYDLKRVFYSAYIPINEDSALPSLDTAPPLLREHRLYQADFLLRFYGFNADELLSVDRPNFNEFVDPKCDWALRHLELFPVDIQSASYEVIMRVPGIGPKSAQRIIKARRYGIIDFEDLKRMGVVLKRAHYFITCKGKMMYNTPIEEKYITRQLISANTKENWQVSHQNENIKQMSLFEDFGISS